MTTTQVTLDDGREFSVEVAFSGGELPTPDSPGEGPDMEITEIWDIDGLEVLKTLDRDTFSKIDSIVQCRYLELQMAAAGEAARQRRWGGDYDWS